MKYIFIIMLFVVGCTDNKEWSTKKIIRLDKQHKLSDAISQIDSMDELNTLMNLLTDDQKKDYLSYTAQKEQNLRFPRPTPMTIEYLDSITNSRVLPTFYNDLDREELLSLDMTLTNQEINDRLILIEANNIRVELDEPISLLMFSNVLTNTSTNESCQADAKKIFFNAIYHDPIDNKYYYGQTIYTNNVDYVLPDTNNIILGTPESILYITNFSPSERLYLDLNTDTLFIRKIERIYDQIAVNVYYTLDQPYNPTYYFFDGYPDPLSRTNTYHQRGLLWLDLPYLYGEETIAATTEDIIFGDDSCYDVEYN